MIYGVANANPQPHVCFKSRSNKALLLLTEAMRNVDKAVEGNGNEALKLYSSIAKCTNKNPYPMWLAAGKDRIQFISPSKISSIYEVAEENLDRNGKKYVSEIAEAREKVKYKTNIESVDKQWTDKLRELKYVRILEDIIKYRQQDAITQEQAFRYMDMLDKIKS